MTSQEDLFAVLQNQPILLTLKANRGGECNGTLSISRGADDVQFNYLVESGSGIHADQFTAGSPHGHFLIQLYGLRSTSVSEINNYPGQHECSYDYILFSSQDNIVQSKTFSKVIFRYHSFFKDVTISDVDAFSIDLFDQVKGRFKRVSKDFRIDVRLMSNQSWQAFPHRKVVEFSRLNFEFSFTKPKTVDEIRAYRHELNNYLAIFLQTTISPVETILRNGETEEHSKMPLYCYLIEQDSRSKIPLSIRSDQALSFSRQGVGFLKHLTRAIQYQGMFLVPMNLMRTYWEYKDKKIYLDNQVSVLLGCVEAIFQLIHAPSDKQKKRETDYKDFIDQLESLTLKADLKKWVVGREEEYSERKPFAEKAKAVVNFTGASITNEKAETLNRLRNDLMHGRFPEWHKYISNYYEQRTETEGAKINLKWLAWIIGEALLKIIRESK